MNGAGWFIAAALAARPGQKKSHAKPSKQKAAGILALRLAGFKN
jgi:hypothetical protein